MESFSENESAKYFLYKLKLLNLISREYTKIYIFLAFYMAKHNIAYNADNRDGFRYLLNKLQHFFNIL